MEKAVTNRFRYRFWVVWSLFKRTIRQLVHLFVPGRRDSQHLRDGKRQKRLQLQINMAKAAIQELKRGITHANQTMTYQVIGEYNKRIAHCRMLKKEKPSQTWRVALLGCCLHSGG